MSRRYRTLLIGFVVLMCILDVLWIRTNTAPPRMFDDALYLTESVDLYHTLQREGLWRFLNASMTHSRAGHPPMMKMFPVPFFVLFGPGLNAALYGYVFLIPLFCLYLFLLARALLDDDKAAVLAVLVACLFPLTYGLWRNVMAEFGMAFATLGALYHLLKSSEFRIKRHALIAGMFIGWGTLWKVSFPLFVAGPIVYLLIQRLRSEGPAQWRPLVLNMTMPALGVCVVAAPFWLRSYRPVVDFLLFSIQQNTHNQNWSLGPLFSPVTVLQYWLNHINVGISVYWFAVIAAALLFYRAVVPKLSSTRALPFLMAWFLPPLLVFSFQVLKEIRHVYPVYPALAILAGALLANVPARALIVLALFPAYLFAASSFDFSMLPRRDMRAGPFVLMTKDLEKASLDLMAVYTYPANPVKLPIEETLQVIASHAAARIKDRPRVRVAGGNPYFNGVTFDLYSRIQRLPLRFENPFNTSISKAEYIVSLAGTAPDLEKLLADQRLPFTPIMNVGDVRVYERTKNPSVPWVRPWTSLAGAKFQYIYIPESGASLQFEVRGACAWQVSVAEMDVEAQPKVMRSSSAAGMDREDVSLNAFKDTIVEIALNSSSPACEFADVGMDYGYRTDYRVQIHPGEVTAGKDSYEFAIAGLSNSIVDIQFTLNDSPTPETFTARLDAKGKATFDVAASTRKGIYKFLGFKINGLSMWIPSNASVVVR